MDFSYLFRILLKRKWIILGSALVAAVLAFVLTLNQPKQYKSTAQVATGYTTYDPIKLVNENADYFSQETKFSNVIVTFSSPAVINLLSYNLALHDLTAAEPYTTLTAEQQQQAFKNISKEEAIAAFRQKLQTMQMLSPSVKEDRKLLDVLNAYGYDYNTLNKKLNVNRLDRTDYLNISYVSENPSLSAFVVNTAYDQFIRYYGTSRDRTAAESIDTLKSIMEKKKQILDEKNALLQRAGLSTSELQSNADLSTIPSLEGELANERTKLNTYEADLRKVNQRLQALSRQSSSSATTDNSELIELKNARNEAYAQYLRTNKQEDFNKYNELKNKYQQKVLSSSVASGPLKDPIAEKTELQGQKSDLEIDIQSSRSYINSLNGRIAALKQNVSSAASLSAASESLIKEAEFANKEYLDAKQRYNAASDIGGSSLVNFRLVVPGQPALNPEPSKRPIIIALAAFAALFTTIAIIIFLTYLDSSVRTPLIFSKNVNLKLISLVNFMHLKDKSITDVIAHRTESADMEERNRNNVFRESLRKLRFEIENSGKKTFLFTSTKKGQGKTTLIQALAYSMSLSKKKVLIIDTNFCNNDLTVQLNAEPVLEKIIPYKTDNQAIVEQVRVFSKDLGLGSVYAIGSEGGDYTPSEILPRENLLQHLDSLKSDFDYIFLEGPPLNDFSDSKELAQYVDGVVAVFSARAEIKQIDKQSMTFYRELNGKFVGSILNMVDLKNINVV